MAAVVARQSPQAAQTRNPSGGLSRSEPFKPHAIKVADTARERMLHGPPETQDSDKMAAIRKAEIQQWKHGVCDLHRVLSVAQGMFLLLEHNNEPLLRVAIEIVCDQAASKVLPWTEEWYSDEDRRVYFREMVLGMLNKCLAYMDVEPEADSTLVDELQEELRLANERASKTEASRAAADHAKSIAQSQLKDMEAQLGDIQTREKELQKANEKLQSELRELRTSTKDGPDPTLTNLIAELEAKLKSAEERNGLLQEKLTKAENIKHPTGASAEELAEAQARMVELEEMMKREKERAAAAEKKAADAAKEVAKLKSDAALRRKPDAKPEDHQAEHEEEVKGLHSALDQQTRRADQLSSENNRMKHELDDLRAEYERLKSAGPETIIVEKIVERKSDDSPTQQKEVVHEAPVEEKPKPQEEVDTPTKQRAGVSQEMYDKLMLEHEKAMAKIESQKSKIKSLNDEKEALETRNDKMLRMLHQLKEQLKKVTEIAEKRGCGDLVRSILDEAGTTATLESQEFTCFDRLYEDAKRRQEKQRLWEQERMGLRPKSPEGLVRTLRSNNTWAAGGTQSGPLGGLPGGAPTEQWGPGEPINTGAMTTPNVAYGMQNSIAGSPFFPSATWPPGSPDPIAMPTPTGAYSSLPTRAWTQSFGSESPQFVGEYDFYDGMRVVGEGLFERDERISIGWGSRPQSQARSRAQTAVGDTRAATPVGTRVEANTRLRQIIGHSRSLGSFSAMSLDVQGQAQGPQPRSRQSCSSPNLLNDQLSNTITYREKLVGAKSLGRLDDVSPSSSSLSDGVLANNIWAGVSNAEKQNGPGMFRGFKLVSQQSKRKLSPFRGGSLHSTISTNADDFLFGATVGM